ncbi:unnamed protein product [Amoebophrya sp. A25]|nr:unnamed protein product [Amoebophrya sp. A25]|eukprot:GSA25T00007944001.1
MTQVEEIEILIRRFIQARLYGREKCVYCIGNIQLLSYQIQCRAVEMLGVLLSEYGVANSAALVLVSGAQNQMLINAATSQCGVQYINVSSLTQHELQMCLKHAVPNVSGAFAEDINGAGKTEFIYREAFAIQHSKDNRKSVYRKLAIRENTDKKEVIEHAHAIAHTQKIEERDDRQFIRLNYEERRSGNPRQPQWMHNGIARGEGLPDLLASRDLHADGGVESRNLNYEHLVHIDLAHVVQKRTNIVLFELLCLGCIVDPTSSTLFFRNPRDRYVVEIPATPGNQLLTHLSVLPLLKKEALTVTENTLQLDKAQFLGGYIETSRGRTSSQLLQPNTRTQLLQIVENTDMLITCKFLRALNGERFLKSAEEDKAAQNDQLLLKEPITEKECWDILSDRCCREDSSLAKGKRREIPSFYTFNLFCRFMRSQFERTMDFALLQPKLSQSMGLDQLRHFFCDLLVSTSADFSLRQVPKYDTMPNMHFREQDDVVMSELSPKMRPASRSSAVFPPAEVDKLPPLEGDLTLADANAASSSSTAIPAVPSGPSSRKSVTAMEVPENRGPAAEANPADSGREGAPQRTSSKTVGRTGSTVLTRTSGAAGTGAKHDTTLRRDMSQQEALTTEMGRERMGAGKVSAESIVERFAGMLSWEAKDHPLSIFKLSKPGRVSGIDILSLNRKTIEKNWKLDRQFTRSLDNNGLKLFKDWSEATPEDCWKLIRMAKGMSTAQPGAAGGNPYAAMHQQGGSSSSSSMGRGGGHQTLGKTHYVLTIDNLLKILSILLRMEYGLPVIIMGETGCGKTALVEFICDTLKFPLKKLDLHGGITDAEITRFFKDCIAESERLKPDEYLVAFLDEINAANCMAHCKTLIVDRFVEDQRLPPNIRIVACCNPYRFRRNREDEQMGLVYQHHFADGGIVSKTDHMKNLVYRVHQLPESLIDLVCDFGALTDETEARYIKSILRRELPFALAPEVTDADGQKRSRDHYETFLRVFANLLRYSQQYIREINNNERAVVSLRDIARASRVFRWFLKHYTKMLASSTSTSTSATSTGNYSATTGNTSSSSSAAPGAASSSAGTTVVLASTGDASRSSASAHSSGRSVRMFVVAEASGDTRGGLLTSLVGTSALSTAVLLTLGFCYHSRLAREDRDGYYRMLWSTVGAPRKSAAAAQQPTAATAGRGGPQPSGRSAAVESSTDYSWLSLKQEGDFLKVLERAQQDFVAQMRLGEGIALNEALRENLFMLMVSVMNQIPILVIGKPGCSKSLAVSILQDNLKGSVSEQPLFKQMPAIEVLPYQCSPLSTADGIQNAFDNARKYQGGGDGLKTIVVVLLDEVGLAEESPHLPLKVLHKELERPGKGITCIGISNWALDAAKMSRAVHLYRSPPTIDDLTLTAEGMICNNQLKMYLRSLAEAFHAIYQQQPRPDFWGLREFYSTVRVVNAELRSRSERGELSVNLDANCLMKTVLRNFGGCTPAEMESNIKKFFSKVGMRAEDGKRYDVVELIGQNLEESDARHLMLLTKNNSALRLLFDSDIISYEKETEILFGSSFPDDQSDVMVATNLNRIRSVMTKPIQLVLIHCDALYESLYDLLNQHYMEFSGQRYVRIAHGSSSKQCPIHHKFRVIVIVEKADAWTKLAPPLLNRFEKQIFVRSQLLTTKEDRILLEKLQDWFELLVQDVISQSGGGAADAAKKAKQLRDQQQQGAGAAASNEKNAMKASTQRIDKNDVKKRCIPGFHSDILPSLVVSLRSLRVEGMNTSGLAPTPAAADMNKIAVNGTTTAGNVMNDGAVVVNSTSVLETSAVPASQMNIGQKLGRALYDLCWVLTPECVTAHIAAKEAGTSACWSKFNPNENAYYPNIGEVYFQQQQHGNLRQYVESLEKDYTQQYGCSKFTLHPLEEEAAGDVGDEEDLVVGTKVVPDDVVMQGADDLNEGNINGTTGGMNVGKEPSSSASSSSALGSGGPYGGSNSINSPTGTGDAATRSGFKREMQRVAQSSLGSQTLCMTYTPMVGGSMLADVLKTESRPVTHFLLHTLSSASDLETLVTDFYTPKNWQAAGGERGTSAMSTTESEQEVSEDVEMASASRDSVEQADIKMKKFLMSAKTEEYNTSVQSHEIETDDLSPLSAEVQHEYLLIEADPIASSDRQIEHCRSICEKAEYLFREQHALDGYASSLFAPGGKGKMNKRCVKHVLLVVHLSRNRADTSTFLLDFDRRWRAIFIDAVGLAEKSGLPDLTQMLNRNLRDVFDLVDFQYVLTNQCLRPSLARLVYPSRRGASALKQQIASLLHLCRSSSFVELLSKLIKKVLERHQKEEEKEYNSKVQAEQGRILKQRGHGGLASASGLTSPRDHHNTFLAAPSPSKGDNLLIPSPRSQNNMEEAFNIAKQNVLRKTWYSEDVEGMTKQAGTFCGALHYRLLRILQAQIAKMLAFFDRNHGLQLFAKFPETSLALAHFIIDDENCKLPFDMQRVLALNDNTGMDDVLNDARSERAPFHGLFPFSYFVAQSIDQLRVIVQAKIEHEDAYKLVQAIGGSNFTLPVRPAFAENEISNLRYVQDFVAINVPHSATLSRWSQTLLLLALIRKSFRVQDAETAKIQEVERMLDSYASESGVMNDHGAPMKMNNNTATASDQSNIVAVFGADFPIRAEFPILQFPSSFFDVHVGYWLNEKRIFFLSEILSCCPLATRRVLDCIQRETEWDLDEQGQQIQMRPYTQNQRLLGFNTLLAAVVIDHLIAELFAELAEKHAASRFKYFSDWVERASRLLQSVQDLLQDCFRYTASSGERAGGKAGDEEIGNPVIRRVHALLQNRVNQFRDVKVLKLELAVQIVRKMSIDCHNTNMDLRPMMEFLRSLDKFDKTSPETESEATTVHRGTFRSILVVEKLLLGFTDLMQKNAEYVESTNYCMLSSTGYGGGYPMGITRSTSGTATTGGDSSQRATNVANQGAATAFLPPERGLSVASRTSSSYMARGSSTYGSSDVNLSTQLRKKLGEILEWLYLDGWLLGGASSDLANSVGSSSSSSTGSGGSSSSTAPQKSSSDKKHEQQYEKRYLLQHLAPDLLKHLCCHASGRPCYIRHGTLMPHEKHEANVIAYVQCGSAQSGTTTQEAVPLSPSFILALLRKLRRLWSPVIEKEIRALLQRAQEKSADRCRDTDFAWCVEIVEEELERDHLKRRLAAEEKQEKEHAAALQQGVATGHMQGGGSTTPSSSASGGVVVGQAAAATTAAATSLFAAGGAVTGTSGSASSSAARPSSDQMNLGAPSTSSNTNLSLSPAVERPAKKARYYSDEDEALLANSLSSCQLESRTVELAQLYADAEREPSKLLEKLRGVARFRAYLTEYTKYLRQEYLTREEQSGAVHGGGYRLGNSTVLTNGASSSSSGVVVVGGSSSSSSSSAPPPSAVAAGSSQSRLLARTSTSSGMQLQPHDQLSKVSTVEQIIREVCGYELCENGKDKVNGKNTFFLRSPRMLALKIWERLGGSSELANAMIAPPLFSSGEEGEPEQSAACQWFKQWRNDGKSQDLQQFVGGTRLPKWNPYHDFNRLPSSGGGARDALSDIFGGGQGGRRSDADHYDKAEELVSQFALHYHSSELDSHLRGMMQKPQDDQRRSLGALCLRLALCGVQRAVTPEPVKYEVELAKWVRNSDMFGRGDFSQAFPGGYVNILLYFLGDDTLRQMYEAKELQNAELFRDWDYWFLTKNSNTEQIAQFRFLPQFLAAVWSAPQDSLLYFFREVMERPSNWGDNGPGAAWLPGMEVDIREVCTSAMKDMAVSFSRFCTCPNGHPYYIADCGQAFTTAKCPECGAEIGGGGHQLKSDNKRMTNDDQSPPGYTHVVDYQDLDPQKKPKPVTKDKYAARRSLAAPSYVCVSRLLLHSAMWCGLVMRTNEVLQGKPPTGDNAQKADKAWPSLAKPENCYRKVANKDYVNMDKVNNEMHWTRWQLMVDWKCLAEFLSSNVEDVSKFLHILIDRMQRRPEDPNMQSIDEDDQKRMKITEARRIEKANKWDMPYARDKRKAWEELFVNAYLEELIPSTGLRRNELADANERWQNVEGPFLAELKENYLISSIAADKRSQEETLLWSYRGEATLDLLQQRTTLRYPILQHLFKIHRQFRCIQHLADVLVFQRFLTTFYSHRKTREEAQQMTVAHMLEEVQSAETPDVFENVSKAFDGFAAAWNEGFGSGWVERWECQDIPNEYKNLKMNEDTKLVFCLADTQNEGICPLALVQTMCEAHNGFLELVREREKHLVRQNYKTNRRRETQRDDGTKGDVVMGVDAAEEDALDEEENINALIAEIDAKMISTRDLVNRFDCLSFSLEDLMVWVKDRATKFTEGGRIDFDFERIESYLVDKFQSKRMLQLELKVVRFTFQDMGSLGNLSALKSKLTALGAGGATGALQGKPLSQEDQTLLRDHFANNRSLAELFQRHLDLVAGFILKIFDATGSTTAVATATLDARTSEQQESEGGGATSLPQMGFLDYCTKTMLQTDEQVQATCGASVMPVVRRMKIRHVVDVLELLDNLSSDVFDAVPVQFRSDLPKDNATLSAALAEGKARMDLDVLLPNLKHYILMNLTESTKPDNNLKEWLGFVDTGDTTLAECPWFEHHFPDELEHRYVCALYNFLSSTSNEEEDDEDEVSRASEQGDAPPATGQGQGNEAAAHLQIDSSSTAMDVDQEGAGPGRPGERLLP